MTVFPMVTLIGGLYAPTLQREHNGVVKSAIVGGALESKEKALEIAKEKAQLIKASK